MKPVRRKVAAAAAAVAAAGVVAVAAGVAPARGGVAGGVVAVPAAAATATELTELYPVSDSSWPPAGGDGGSSLALAARGCALDCHSAPVGPAVIKGDVLAKPNYQFEKRQRDLAKKKKQEEKRLRKLAEKTGVDDTGSGVANDPSAAVPLKETEPGQ